MLAEFITPAGVRDGDPETLAALCAVGGYAVVAYCGVAGVHDEFITPAAVTALATFRRGVADDGEQDAAQLERLLLLATRDAVWQVAGAYVTAERLQEADAAFTTEPVWSLEPGLVRDIIGALVGAAPVAALDGDGAAVREVAEQRYARAYERQEAWGDRQEAWGTPAARPAPAAQAGGANAWVPAELGSPGAPAVEAEAEAPMARWDSAPPAYPPRHEPPPPPPAPGGRPRPRPPRRAAGGAPSGRRVLLAGAVTIGAIAAAVIVIISMTPEPTGRQGGTRVHQVDTPFTAAGAVFEIAPTSTAEWAIDVREREPGQGREWLTLAARARNVTGQSFYPRTLGYRLRTSSGVIIGPQTAVVPPELSDPDGRVRPGQRTSVHLGFQVPDEQTDLSLEFDPGPGSPRVRVPLN